jgi:hypothetical protein
MKGRGSANQPPPASGITTEISSLAFVADHNPRNIGQMQPRNVIAQNENNN